jgi:hypothetical protein
LSERRRDLLGDDLERVVGAFEARSRAGTASGTTQRERHVADEVLAERLEVGQRVLPVPSAGGTLVRDPLVIRVLDLEKDIRTQALLAGAVGIGAG